jgi:hypothetical protein
VAPERDDDGHEVPRRHAVRFHFLILKDGRVLSGTSASNAARWSGTTEPAVQGLTAGPALALGLTVEPRTGATPTLETASWAQEIDVQFLVPGDADL